MKEYDIHTFPNGVRLVHKQASATKVAHCGIMLDVGSRDEGAHQVGLSHFWEHMAFKGTGKRKAFHILNRLDSLGGDLNAYTTKEKLCFHASVLHEHFDKAIELLADITFNSTFPEKELEKEKLVIKEEISMYENDPADAIHDEFDEVLYGDHPLGKNILGEREQLGAFTRDDLVGYVNEALDTHRIVISYVGPDTFQKIKKVTERYILPIPELRGKTSRKPFTGAEVKSIKKEIEGTQAHYAQGIASYSLHDPKRVPMFILSNILGGPASNSRLNLKLREKHGYVYHIESSFTSFIDTGYFSIFFSAEPEYLGRCVKLVNGELAKLRDVKLGAKQFHHAIQQIKGQMAIADESNINFMLMMAKCILDLDKVHSLEEVFTEIDAVTPEMLMEVANEMLDPEKMCALHYMPKK